MLQGIVTNNSLVVLPKIYIIFYGATMESGGVVYHFFSINHNENYLLLKQTIKEVKAEAIAIR